MAHFDTPRKREALLKLLPPLIEKAKKRVKRHSGRGNDAYAEVRLPLFRSVLFSAPEDTMSPFVMNTHIGRFVEDELKKHSVNGWHFFPIFGTEIARRRRIIGVGARRH